MRGFARILDHDRIKIRELRNTDEVVYWFFNGITRLELLTIELAVIRKFQPLYNKSGIDRRKLLSRLPSDPLGSP
jgi:hypothetical protein